MPFPALLLSVVASASTWVVDGTSLAVVRGQEPVASHIGCPSIAAPSNELHTLGVAVVAYSKKQGTMTWGHASLRVMYCIDGELHDVEYEMYRLSAWNEQQLRNEHPAETFAHDDWLGTQRGRLVLFRNNSPVDGGWYAEAQADNREIYEVWLDLTLDDRNGVTRRIEARYRDQLARLRAHEDLERRYVAWKDNCTAVYEVLPDSLLEQTGFALTPFAWVRHLDEAHAVRARVMYPSHHLVKRWVGELPAESRRVHPVFRRPARLSLPLVGRLHAEWLDTPPAVAALFPSAPLPQQGRGSVWYRRPMTSSSSP